MARDRGAWRLSAPPTASWRWRYLTSDVDLGVNVLTSGGDTLNNVTVKGIVEHQAIRINEASAELPGRSSARFDGIIFPGEGAAELGGKLLFESSDFRGFMGWLTPERKAAFDASWKGSRGRMVIKSDLDWTQSRFGMQKFQFEFDGAPGDGEISLRLGKVSGLDLKLNAVRLDLDNLLPQGFSLLPNSKALALTDVLAPLLAGQDVAERHLALKVDALQLNGVTAKDVLLDATTGLSGIEIKSLRVGNVDGAALSGDGLVLSSPEGPSGTLKFTLAADEPSGFLRLAGLLGQAGPASWASVLGKTNVNLDVSASHDQQGATLQVSAKGSSGPLAFESNSLISHMATLANASVDVKAVVSSPDGSNLVRLLSLNPLQTDDAAGEARIAIKGDLTSGLDTEATIQALDGTASFKGMIQPALPHLGIDGKMSFNASSVAKLRRIFGVPFDEVATGGLNVSAHVTAEGTVLNLSELQGQILGQSISGNASLDDKHKLTADLSTGPLSAKDVLAWGLLDWDATSTDLTKGFADPKAAVFPKEIYVHPQALDMGFGEILNEAVIGYGATAEGVTLSLRQPGPQDQNLELNVKPLGASYDVSVHGQLRLDAAKLLAAPDGTNFVEGELQIDGSARGEGRSPAAVLASFAGKGSYWLSNGVLKRITLDGFANAVNGATTQNALTAALNGLDSAPGTTIGERTGAFTMENGTLAVAPFGPAVSDSSATVNATADLTSGTVQVATNIDIKSRSDLPPVTITYSGAPGAIQKRSGTAALAAKLGYQLLAKDMAALEAVQQQQAALAAQEETQRKEDEQRFAAYQEQREELRKRQRERRVFAAEKVAQASAVQAGLANALQIGDSMNKADLAAHIRVNAARRIFAVAPY